MSMNEQVIGVYYVFNIIFVSISLSSTILILKIHHNGRDGQKVPQWLKKILFLDHRTKQEIENRNLEKIKKNQHLKQSLFVADKSHIEKLNFSDQNNSNRIQNLHKITKIGKDFIKTFKKERSLNCRSARVVSSIIRNLNQELY